jgi:hypothetical protein
MPMILALRSSGRFMLAVIYVRLSTAVNFAKLNRSEARCWWA